MGVGTTRRDSDPVNGYSPSPAASGPQGSTMSTLAPPSPVVFPVRRVPARRPHASPAHTGTPTDRRGMGYVGVGTVGVGLDRM